jgi:hypothetical protein
MQVPEFTVQDLDKGVVRYSPSDRDVTVVIFVGSRCPMSNAFNFRLNELYKALHDKAKFLVINSNANESAQEVRQHSRNMEYDFLVYKDFDNVVADLFGAGATPDSFVVNRDGTVVYHGLIEDSVHAERAQQHYLRDALDATLAGRPVAVPETHALGCAIRRVGSVNLE